MRQLILMGSYMEHITTNDEAAKDSLMKGLDEFLERDRDRALFDLPPKKDSNPYISRIGPEKAALFGIKRLTRNV